MVAKLAVGALIAGVGLVLASLTGCAERLFYWPDRGAFATPERIGGGVVEDVEFESADGTRLHGWFIRGVSERAGGVRPDGGEIERLPTIVHCHGNAGNVDRHSVFVDFLPGAGFNVLLFDYRGYGRSERGPMRRDELVADAVAAIEYVRTRGDVDASRVGVYGLSLGGTMGLAAAAEVPGVRAVVSVATFSEWKSVAGDFAGWLGRVLVRRGRDAVESVGMLGERPLLVVHGTADEVVAFRHAGPIVEAAREAGVAVELVELAGAGHVTWRETHPEAAERIVEFLERELSAE